MFIGLMMFLFVSVHGVLPCPSSVVMHSALHSAFHSAYLLRCHSAFHAYAVAVEAMVMSYISVVTAAVVVAAAVVAACSATVWCDTWW